LKEEKARLAKVEKERNRQLQQMQAEKERRELTEKEFNSLE
jgi:hypothetical protein